MNTTITQPIATTAPPAWEVVCWYGRKERTELLIKTNCECGFEGHVPTVALPEGVRFVEQTTEGFLIFTPFGYLPPPGWMPQVIKCPKCGETSICERGLTETIEP